MLNILLLVCRMCKMYNANISKMKSKTRNKVIYFIVSSHTFGFHFVIYSFLSLALSLSITLSFIIYFCYLQFVVISHTRIRIGRVDCLILGQSGLYFTPTVHCKQSSNSCSLFRRVNRLQNG